MALVLAAASTGAVAQSSQLADELEWKRLDIRPRPTLLREPGVQFYGRLDLAVARIGGRSWVGHERVPSYWGVRGDQRVGGGWRVRFELEQGFDASGPLPAETPSPPPSDCGTSFGRACWVELEHPGGAALAAGRDLQPAYRIAALADPWLGAAGATDPPLLYAAPGGADAAPKASRHAPRIRTSQALRLRSPDWANHRVEMVGSLPDAGQPAAEVGAAWRYEQGAWLLGVGWHRWDADHEAIPVSAIVRGGLWRLHLGATLGRTEGRRYHGTVLGLTAEGRSGVRPLVWRLALAAGRVDGGPRQGKLALGFEQRRGPRVALYGNLAWGRQTRDAGWVLELGVRQGFVL